ncbi:uncharacterized protein MYCFIDRAFT_182979 [Pseudocercospora fijiensis CIRAD86]|uniref:Uncharacterized protein n=1 Tax=Pseudocercospora fijiensis (strain CIRAD86) TaxID=383855 RepID=M2YW44_PSEFD|nr:uncharacterized protein MYCFIDRAFT_182979 [Pseudocercospora fijiensis CIRAD86]EME81940.1 hypothetical protein MYCFIDRAFT_182979 [Pseudocercospora fijiensis CIRAD86]
MRGQEIQATSAVTRFLGSNPRSGNILLLQALARNYSLQLHLERFTALLDWIQFEVPKSANTQTTA